MILHDSQRKPENITPVASVSEILELRDWVGKVNMSRQLAAYIVAFVSATRDHPHVRLGASVRGTIALAQAAKAGAVLDGREYVIPDDIHRWAAPVLSHRMMLKRGAAQGNITAVDVLSEIRRELIVP
jgi:MoxR-like ATPase